MTRTALVIVLAALASPAAAWDHFDEGQRLFPLSYQSQRAEEIAEIYARVQRCPDLKIGPGLKILGRGLLRGYPPPPATQPDPEGIRAWISVEAARRLAAKAGSPAGPECESLRNRYGLAKIVVERSGKVATPACAKDGTCPSRTFIEIF